MDKRRAAYFTLGVGVLLLVIVVMLARGGQRESGSFTLPESQSDTPEVGGGSAQGNLNVVEITPETVQTAIATLSRPASYSRTQTVETFWSGGAGQTVSQVYVSGGRTRLDTQLTDGSVRHMLLAGTLAGVWYDEEQTWTVLPAGTLTADLAGRMLSYETLLDLPVSRIAAADYRELDGTRCIYVETDPDREGYADRYWVSVGNGLLYAAERRLDGETVYRFTATTPESGTPAEELFLLPDGGTLESAAER